MVDVVPALNAARTPDPLGGLGESERRQLAARLGEARRHTGLLQDDVAGALGLSRSTVSAIERGKRRVTPLELRSFARLYGRHVGWFLSEERESSELFPLRATAELHASDKQEVLRSAEIWVGASRS